MLHCTEGLSPDSGSLSPDIGSLSPDSGSLSPDIGTDSGSLSPDIADPYTAGPKPDDRPLRRFLGDLHLHTVLSPCAAPEMTPPAMIAVARDRGLDLIAICDHNAAGNALATQRAAAIAGAGIAVLAGIEITTVEEVHVLGLFDDAAAAEAVGDAVRATLPPLRDPPRWVGPQLLVDENGQPRGREPRMLFAASELRLGRAVALIHEHGGLAIAAHVDRPSFSLLAQLGFVPDDAPLDALEVSAAGLKNHRAEALAIHGMPLLCSSDAHSLDEIGDGVTFLDLAAPTLAELRLALRSSGGRRCSLA